MIDVRTHSNRACSAATVLACFVLTGCTGSSSVNILSLDATSIDPPSPAVFKYDAQECYWWKTDRNDIAVALRCQRGTFLGLAGEVELELSFVLSPAPAGNAKDYRIGRREIRGAFSVGLDQHRFASYQGVVSVTVQKDGTLAGSYRLWLIHQPGSGLFNLFPRQPGQLLFFGRFTAIPDRNGRGAAILERTESAGWERPAPASAPASGTAVTK